MYDFKSTYTPASAIEFLDNFLPEDFKKFEEEIKLDFKPQRIYQVKKIGEVSSLENLNIYEVLHESENDPRISLSKDSFRLLADYGVRKALIFFTSKNSPNYRLSLVTVDLTLDGSKVRKEYSNPRRYSFFLGPNSKIHTPEEHLIKRGKIRDYSDLKERFSIEVVNKDFYNRISALFAKLAGGKRYIGSKKIDEKGCLHLPSTSEHRKKQEFATRLLGRIIFCWFLKKKKSLQNNPIIPDDFLSSKALNKTKGFYHKILEPLFFQQLNTPLELRREEYRDGVIPFLNGGLFQQHDDDFYEIDSFHGSSKFTNVLIVPDDWLKNLFEVLESYNFTIDESTPIDIDLSIDPEILGRIFENLLAEINPETGETARKATGSYYTPRTVVEYMVDESLKYYLADKTGIDLSRLTEILSYDKDLPSLTPEEINALIESLYELKIIDPACGSGAFPVGILQKVVLILQKTDPDCKMWLDKQIAYIQDASLHNILKGKLKNENLDYIRKLGVVQNTVYGIDIQPLAIEIAKLRFFLSLVIDEDVDDTKINRGLQPLPNLEFKFVCANSLINVKDAPSSDFINDNFFDPFKKLTGYYFAANDPVDKQKLRKGIEILIERKSKANVSRMMAIAKEHIIDPELDKKTKQKHQKEIEYLAYEMGLWESYLNIFKDEPVRFFNTSYFFPEVKDGFDIVIANPPYGSAFDAETKKNLFRLYPVLKGQPESYEYFIYISIYRFARDNGIVSFINPTNFIESQRAEGLRECMLNEGNVLTISNFRFNVWKENAAETLIFIYRKTKHITATKILHPKNMYDFINNRNIDFLDQRSWLALPRKRFLIRASLKLIAKIENECIPLGSVSEISQGIIVYKTKADGKKNLYISEKANDTSWKKLLDGHSKLKPYAIQWGGRFLKYSDRLWCPRDEKFFIRPKIVFIRLRNKALTRKLVGAYDEEQYYNRDNFNNIISKDDSYSLKYLMAVFNSKVVNYWYKAYFDNVNINPAQVRMIPIKILSNEEQKPFIDVVEDIISITGNDDYFNNHAKLLRVEKNIKQIDDMIYNLYGLTEEEIRVVEDFNT